MNDQEFEFLKQTAGSAAATKTVLILLIDALKNTQPKLTEQLAYNIETILHSDAEMTDETNQQLQEYLNLLRDSGL